MQLKASGIRGQSFLALAIWVMLLGPTTGYAQRHGGGSGHPRGEAGGWGGSSGSSEKPAVPEPYGGQLFCPVTGMKLGLNEPAVEVQTNIGEQKPSFVGKMFGKKAVPGAVIFVCCPKCAATVQKSPQLYLTEVIADKACFNFTYRTAPAKRPPREGADGTLPIAAPTQPPVPVNPPPTEATR